MKNYIDKVDNKTRCDHPQVIKFYEWGGCSMTDASNKIYHYATIILKDGTRRDFGPNEDHEVSYYDCNTFLNQIGE
jgi:hypothetical protein